MASDYAGTLAICEKYFAGQAQKFLDRQITLHLNKPTEAIGKGDMPELARWCKISGALLIGTPRAEQLFEELQAA